MDSSPLSSPPLHMHIFSTLSSYIDDEISLDQLIDIMSKLPLHDFYKSDNEDNQLITDTPVSILFTLLLTILA